MTEPEMVPCLESGCTRLIRPGADYCSVHVGRHSFGTDPGPGIERADGTPISAQEYNDNTQRRIAAEARLEEAEDNVRRAVSILTALQYGQREVNDPVTTKVWEELIAFLAARTKEGT